MATLQVHGADFSHHQDALDLRRARDAGLKFFYHKATEGTTLVDAEYTMRRVAAKALGIPFGAYHFARPDGADAVAEARAFMAKADPKPGDLVPALDMEVAGNHEAWCKTFMAEVERILKSKGLLGKPIHYGPNDYGPDYGYMRWVPRYNLDNRLPDVPWHIFQFSGGADLRGTPATFPGLGFVDLNHLKAGVKLEQFTLKADKPLKPVKPPKKHDLIRFAHLSMQFSDTPAQVTEDAKKLFARPYDIITGTEANPGEHVRAILREEATNAGFKFHAGSGSDSWIAVRKGFIFGGWEEGVDAVIGHYNQEGSTRKFGAKGVTWVQFDTEDLGRIGVMGAHYLTGGAEPGPASVFGKANHYELNRKLARAVGKRADLMAKGTGLALYGGDQNIQDAKLDTFMSEAKMTSTWDELGKYQNTGHGVIDVIATHDKDARVVAKATQALPDGKVFFHTDHFLVEAVLDVECLVAKQSEPKPA